MEEQYACELHGEILNMYCPTCKIPVCTECTTIHTEKNCAKTEFLHLYFKDKILPLYKKQIDDFEEKKYEIEKSVNDYINSMSESRRKLIKVKLKLENILQKINQIIEIVPENPTPASLLHNVRKIDCMDHYVRLEEAIKRNNFVDMIGLIQTTKRQICCVPL